MTELADHVRAKADQLIADHGRIGDEHLMLMSAILIADELWDEREGKGTPPDQRNDAAAADKASSRAKTQRPAREKTPETTS